jgi:hypothetical protein
MLKWYFHKTHFQHHRICVNKHNNVLLLALVYIIKNGMHIAHEMQKSMNKILFWIFMVLFKMKIFYRAFEKALVLWIILIFSEFFEGFRKQPFLIQNSKSSNLKHVIFGHILNL